ncbi:Hypothetical_protein [Hexamita inflata]|uniref:Hypothetical_protein n=1 Tax=Hexamita inflata TaxID=28002 RepID=A0AA86UDI8_9EUKA|nr:Hypothetical protein HINF_LOCUS41550 [Hexamita inflata]
MCIDKALCGVLTKHFTNDRIQLIIYQAVPKHAVSAVLGTRFSAAPHAAAVSAEPRFLAVFSWVFLVLAEKLHLPGFEPETKRMQDLILPTRLNCHISKMTFNSNQKILYIVMNSNIVET